MGRKRSLRKSITCAVIVVIVLSSGVAYGQSEILRDAIYPSVNSRRGTPVRN